MTRGRRWTVTLNNPTCLIDALWHAPLMNYLIAGKETCPTTGTPHYQIYLETKVKKTIAALAGELAQRWGTHPHLIISDGSQKKNKLYAEKDKNGVVEFGVPMAQGARTDLTAVIADIASGKSMNQLWYLHPEVLIKYGNGIRNCYQVTSPNNLMTAAKTYGLQEFNPWPTVNIQTALEHTSVILHGPSNTGKTCYARALLPKALFVTHMDDLLKYDMGTHDGLIFDDISLVHLHREAQIHVLDFDQPRSIHCRYQVATLPAGTKKIFTTNNDGGFIYLAGDPALERRVTKFHLTDRGEPEGEELLWDEVMPWGS